MTAAISPNSVKINAYISKMWCGFFPFCDNLCHISVLASIAVLSSVAVVLPDLQGTHSQITCPLVIVLFSYTYIFIIQFNLRVHHSKMLCTIANNERGHLQQHTVKLLGSLTTLHFGIIME